MLPLDNVRVVDFSWAMAGPIATQLLAFLGAEVIKIESRKHLDMMRRIIDPITHTQVGLDTGFKFMDFNFGKLSTTIDITTVEGKYLVKRLVKESDVVLENFRPGTMARLGLSYEDLKLVNPGIVMVSISFSGENGPEAGFTGYAPMFSSLAGLGHLTGYPDLPPAEMRDPIDTEIALTATFAALAALTDRQRSGRGQHVDVSGREAISCLIGDAFMDHGKNGDVQSRSGNRDEVFAPHGCYPCSGEDSWISIAITCDDEWEALCGAIGRNDLLADSRFGDARKRWLNQDDLDRVITDWTNQRNAYSTMDILQSAGVAAVPSFTAVDVFTDPHLAERGHVINIEHPLAGIIMELAAPWRLSAMPIESYRCAPLLGQHNDYVFGEILGLSRDEMADLSRRQVIY